MKGAFYNEHDKYAAEWLRNLIAAGHIARGIVDERDIRDIRPDELLGFTQCHFFAGIGVWSYALRRAGWPDDRPIWTGSCPCQPFSAAGTQAGFDDERHLWPHWHWLIDQCRPPVVVGEQVASADGLNWLDLVLPDLEASNYAAGAADLCAAGFGGAHIRQRLYFVGVANGDDAGLGGVEATRLHERRAGEGGEEPAQGGAADGAFGDDPDGRGLHGGMADAEGGRHGEHERNAGAMGRAGGRDEGQEPGVGGASQAARNNGENGELAGRADGRLADAPNTDRGSGERGTEAGTRSDAERGRGSSGGGADGGLAHADDEGPQGRPGGVQRADQRPLGESGVGGGLVDANGGNAGAERQQRGGEQRLLEEDGGDGAGAHGHAHAPMLGRKAADWLFCRDGRWRPVEPGTFPLAHGITARVGRLRAYGNALDAETAEGFVSVVMEMIDEDQWRRGAL